LSGTEQSSFLHVAGEAFRVLAAVDALKNADSATFGKLLYASHDSMRDQLRISTAALDRLVETARDAGALGARLTGAGFGGCAVVFCKTANLTHVRTQLIARYYAGKSDFDPVKHLITAEASAGALFA
jgi:galactokinase